MTKFVIPALQFKKFADPFETLDSALHGTRPTKYRFYVKTTDVPEKLMNWLSTNPRNQNLNTDVSKAIRASLEDDNMSFHLWNRGILLSAAKITFDNRTNKATMLFEDPAVHGNIDGGHTLKNIIVANQKAAAEKRELPVQFVEFEVITGLQAPEDLAEARNTSVPVDTKSMEELKKTFGVLKDIIKDHTINGNRYIDRIEFKQNQMRGEKNIIDIREVVSILNMFNQKLYDNSQPNIPSPIQSFSGKEVSLNRFLQMDLPDDTPEEKVREYREGLLENMAPIIPSIFEFWDYIECHFTEATSSIGKRYGSKSYSNFEMIKKINTEIQEAPSQDAKVKAQNKLPKSLFSCTPLRYSVPRGIMYPLVGSFRALVQVDSDGKYSWKVDPITAWNALKEPLATYVMSASDECSNMPTAIGKSKNLWNSLFLTVSFYANTPRR